MENDQALGHNFRLECVDLWFAFLVVQSITFDYCVGSTPEFRIPYLSILVEIQKDECLLLPIQANRLETLFGSFLVVGNPLL